MNGTELTKEIATRAGVTLKVAEKMLRAKCEIIGETLAKNEKVSIIGFGTYESKAREERKGRHPQTGAEITIPASKNPVFKAGKGLKDVVNN